MSKLLLSCYDCRKANSHVPELFEEAISKVPNGLLGRCTESKSISLKPCVACAIKIIFTFEIAPITDLFIRWLSAPVAISALIQLL